MNSYNDKFQKKVEEEDSLDDFDDFLKTSPSEDEFFLENNDLIDKSKQTKGSDDKTIPGLVYISNLPPKMTPLYIRQIFSKYGEVGRVYLQPDGKLLFYNLLLLKSLFKKLPFGIFICTTNPDFLSCYYCFLKRFFFSQFLFYSILFFLAFWVSFTKKNTS